MTQDLRPEFNEWVASLTDDKIELHMREAMFVAYVQGHKQGSDAKC